MRDQLQSRTKKINLKYIQDSLIFVFNSSHYRFIMKSTCAAFALSIAVFTTPSEAFSPSSHVLSPRFRVGTVNPPPLFMSDDLPSDSSSAEALDVESEAFAPDVAEELVTSMLDDLPSSPSFSVTKETRSRINEALLKLESVNPTEDPAASPLLNGVWALRYAGGYASEGALPSPTRQLALFLYSGGYSPGLFGLNVASSLPAGLVETDDYCLTVSREQPRVRWSSSFKILGVSQEASATARLDVESGVRCTERYESAELAGQSVEIPSPLRYAREILISYLDEDVLVLRDATGVPEVYLRKEYGA